MLQIKREKFLIVDVVIWGVSNFTKMNVCEGCVCEYRVNICGKYFLPLTAGGGRISILFSKILSFYVKEICSSPARNLFDFCMSVYNPFLRQGILSILLVGCFWNHGDNQLWDFPSKNAHHWVLRVNLYKSNEISGAHMLRVRIIWVQIKNHLGDICFH